MKIRILPSLLAADIGNLEAGAKKAEAAGADELHLDIMDGNFVPNISMGPDVVAMANKCLQIPLSVHLMLSHPDQYLEKFIEAGADSVQIHIEAECDVSAALDKIRELGAKPGITVNPETPIEMIFPVLDKVDEVLIMTVHPGYGGQSFMPEVLPKIKELHDHISSMEKDIDIIIDGGINSDNVVECAAQGASAFVAGTSLYKAPDMAAELSLMRKNASDAFIK